MIEIKPYIEHAVLVGLITPNQPEERTKEYLVGNFRLGLEQVRARLFYFGNSVQTYGRILPPDEVVAGIAAVTLPKRVLRPSTGRSIERSSSPRKGGRRLSM